MKPNHHWAIHTKDQLRDYGPMPNFWAFLTERLNKLLKSSNANGRGGGQMEVSMMREFYRDSQLQFIVSFRAINLIHMELSSRPTALDAGGVKFI